jgi:hypothetical protein
MIRTNVASMLAWMAACTSRICVAPRVLGIHYRPTISTRRSSLSSPSHPRLGNDFVQRPSASAAIREGADSGLGPIQGRSADVVSELLLETVDQLANAFEELTDAAAVALESPTSS